MKKIISWGMMLAAAFTLTNCAKEIDAPVQEPETVGYPFEIIASTVDTKTVNDGMSTNWTAGDKINLFHAEAGTTDYKNDAAFTLKEGETDKFTGNLAVDGALDPQKDYDWYAFYPYTSQIASPENKAGWAFIGNRNGITQDGGYGKTAHLASSNCPLYGVAKAVAADTPSIDMRHLSSVVAINVTNITDEPLTVTSATLTANEPIVGSFYIDFSESPTYTASDGQYVSNAATVNVKGGTALGNGDSGVLYLVVKPFTAAKDSKLCLSVNGYEKELTMPQDVTFTAGKIKTLNFSYNKVEAPVEPEESMTATLTFDDAAKRIVSTKEQQVWVENDITLTYNKAGYNNDLAEYEKPARFYANTTISLEAPGNIESIEFVCNTTAYATALKNAISGSSVNSKIVTVTLDGSSPTVTYTMTAQVRMDALTVKYVKADPSAPSITAGNVTGVSARGVEAAVLTYEIANLEYSDLTVTCDGTVVTSASKGEDGVINYAVSANSTASAREGFITISYGDLDKEVKVSQLAPVFTVSKDAVELGATKDSKTTVTVTSDFGWTLSSEGTGYTVTPDSYTWAGDGKQQVTIQATADRTEEGVADLGTITIVNATTGQELTIKVTQATSYVSAESETVTMNIYANKGTLSGKSISWTQNGFTVTNNQASSSNAIRTSDSDHFRLYAKSELIFTSSSKKFNKVVVTCAGGSSYVNALVTSAKNAGLTATTSGSVVTISTSNPTTAMPTITMSAQSRINKVVVELN